MDTYIYIFLVIYTWSLYMQVMEPGFMTHPNKDTDKLAVVIVAFMVSVAWPVTLIIFLITIYKKMTYEKPTTD